MKGKTKTLTSKRAQGPKGPQALLTRATYGSVSGKHWDALKPAEKSARIRSLSVIGDMRSGKSFSSSVKHAGTTPKVAKANLKGYIYKRRGRWHARAIDSIERSMIIYTKGKIISLIIDNNIVASTIGRYLNDVKFVLIGKLGYDEFIKRYKGMSIIDIDGKSHKLETRQNKLKDIELSREDIPFSDVYAF
jgi:hypothetical protein